MPWETGHRHRQRNSGAQRDTAGHSGTAVPRPPGTGGSRPDHTSSEANSVRVLRFSSSIPSRINFVSKCVRPRVTRPGHADTVVHRSVTRDRPSGAGSPVFVTPFRHAGKCAWPRLAADPPSCLQPAVPPSVATRGPRGCRASLIACNVTRLSAACRVVNRHPSLPDGPQQPPPTPTRGRRPPDSHWRTFSGCRSRPRGAVWIVRCSTQHCAPGAVSPAVECL